MVATSWDSDVRIWGVGFNGLSPLTMYKHQAPVLCSAFMDEKTVLSGGADRTVLVYDMGSQKSSIIGEHKGVVSRVHYNPSYNMVVSGGWDQTLAYWDARTKKVAGTVALDGKVYDMDMRGDLIYVVLSNQSIALYDIKSPQSPVRVFKPDLKMMMRCVGSFADNSGFVVGSIEGRCAIVNNHTSNDSKNFIYRCHRVNNTDIYAVNSISFHPGGAFATAGSDGTVHIWDKDARSRLKAFPSLNSPVTAGVFSPDGRLYAYATGYDWSKGYLSGATTPRDVIIRVHSVTPEEVRLKPPTRR